MQSSRSLALAFDSKANGLNSVRLGLAASVILWHSFPLTGSELGLLPLRQLLSEAGVDGFFAISGFLILRSWERNPHALRYLWARVLRILPGFWVCLAITALVIAPATSGVLGVDNWSYIWRNAGLWIVQYGIAGTLAGVPFPAVWNGSVWTLAWEFFCYLGVLVLGVFGFWHRRLLLPIGFVVCVLVSGAVTAVGIDSESVQSAARFATMFSAGALIWAFRELVPVRADLIWLAVGLTCASALLPNYRVLAALPLAYVLIVTGAMAKSPIWRLPNDISYGLYIYAFPVQQVLAGSGAVFLGVGWFALLSLTATVPLAVASWLLVEKPVLRLKPALSAAVVPSAEASVPSA